MVLETRIINDFFLQRLIIMSTVFKKLEKEHLQKIIDSSSSYVEIIQKIGLSKNNNYNVTLLKKTIERLNCSTTQLDINREAHRRRSLFGRNPSFFGDVV